MAAGSYVVTALATVGAAVGGLAVIGTSAAESPAVSPVNCVTDGSATSSVSSVLDRTEADADEADETADCRTAEREPIGGSGPLTSRARADSNSSGSNNSGSNNSGSNNSNSNNSNSNNSNSNSTARQSADDLAQELADALAGSTDSDALRIAAALTDAGYVASDASAASGQDETIGDSEDTGPSTRSGRSSRNDDGGGSERVSSSVRRGVDTADSSADSSADEDGFETIASVLERTSPGRSRRTR
jgi:hypothetical protein